MGTRKLFPHTSTAKLRLQHTVIHQLFHKTENDWWHWLEVKIVTETEGIEYSIDKQITTRIDNYTGVVLAVGATVANSHSVDV